MKEKITAAYTAFSNTFVSGGIGCLISGGIITTFAIVLVSAGLKLGIYDNEEDI